MRLLLPTMKTVPGVYTCGKVTNFPYFVVIIPSDEEVIVFALLP
jgi:hypothetical protein